jgi:predicted N-acyltransferase
MDFEIQVAHSVEEVGRGAWDRLSQGRPFASYNWYRYGEAVLADNIPVYIILSRQGEPIARATFWLRRQEVIHVPSRLWRRLVEILLRRWPLLLCKSPLADTSGLILPAPPLRDAALKTISQVALDQARQYRVSFAGHVYLEEHEAKYAGWPDVFAAFELPDPGTQLNITWPDFEIYLSCLSKKTRRQYRLNGYRAADEGIEVKLRPIVEPLDEPTLDKAVALIRNVERHHNSASNPWVRGMLKHAHLVANAIWLKAEVDGQMVGCCTVLGDGKHRMMKLLGLDYAVRYTYFQLIYSAIRCAIEDGAQTLWGGATAYHTKQKLGFQLTGDNYAVIAGRGRLLQKLGHWLGGEEESRVANPYEVEEAQHA